MRSCRSGATCAIPSGHKVGLVGRNGAGKTTLFKLIIGDLAPDDGAISIPRSLKVGHVAQEAPGGDESLIEWVLSQDKERAALLAEAEIATDPNRIAAIHERLGDIDAHSAPSRAAQILSGLGFDERAQARGASAGTEGVVKLPSNKTPQADATETKQDPTTEPAPAPRVAPYTQQQRPQTQQQQPQTPTQQPTSETQQPTTPSTSTETKPSTPPSSETPPPPSSSAAVTPPSSNTPPASNPLPTPSNPVDVSVDLGLLDPVLNTVGDTVGGFDFFAPVI